MGDAAVRQRRQGTMSIIAPLQNGDRVPDTTLRGGRSKRQLRAKRILIVEDSYLVAVDLMNYLEQLGCIVAGPTGHLDEAFRLMRGRLDGAILDALLRDKETSEPIAIMLRRMAVPFFVISAHPRHLLPPELSRAPYLGKPLSRKAVQNQAVALFADR